MLNRIIAWLNGSPGFKIPDRKDSISRCEVRPMRETDISACEQIYALNETDHFPLGFAEHFGEWLRSQQSMIVVAEIDGEVCGLGGIDVRLYPGARIAWITFGMVHPSRHKQGIGTALLLARLSCLPASVLPCTLLMASAGASNTFYRQFGFAFWRRLAVKETELDHYRVLFTDRDRKKCEHALAQIRLSPNLHVVAENSILKNLAIAES